MELTNYNKAKADVCRMIIEASRKNLKTPHRRVSFRIKWEKWGPHWYVKSATASVFTAASKTTGDLSRSMKYEVKDDDLYIKTLNYGRWVDLGRLPGKYVPVKDLEEWMDKKGIKAPSFVLNRKIKFFGIQASKFLTNAVNELSPIIPEILMDAYMKDLVIELDRLLSVKDAIGEVTTAISKGKAESLTGGYFKLAEQKDKVISLNLKENKTDRDYERLKKMEDKMHKTEEKFWKENFLATRATNAVDVWLLQKLKIPGLKSALKIPTNFLKNYTSIEESAMSMVSEVTEADIAD